VRKMNKVNLERLINKPRAFRHSKFSSKLSMPERQTMIFLGSENLQYNSGFPPNNYIKFRKLIKNRQLFL